MPSKPQARKATKGAVQFKNTKGRWQIVFSHSVGENGEIQRQCFYRSMGYDDTPLNRQRVGANGCQRSLLPALYQLRCGLVFTGARPAAVIALQWKPVGNTVIRFRQAIVMFENSQ